MAAHAHAVGDNTRAARGWLLAAEEALRRAAVEDARTLVERVPRRPRPRGGDAGAGAAGPAAGCTRRPRAGTAAIQDIDAALAWARRDGERRLELAALRARGGDAAVGAQLAADELLGPLEDGVRLAAELGDRRAEADFASRLAVLEASRLRLTDARRRAEQVLARARAAGLGGRRGPGPRRRSRPSRGTSGTRTPWPTWSRELEPLVRARHDAWLLQWVVFESAFVPGGVRPVGRGARPGGAGARPQPSQRLPRLRGLPPGLRRLARPARRATSTRRRRLGRRAVEDTSAVDHPWWHSWAAGLLAATLVRDGRDAPRRWLWPAPGWPRGAARRARGGCCAPRRSRPSPVRHAEAAADALSRRGLPARPGLGARAPTPTSCWPDAAAARGDHDRGRPAGRPVARGDDRGVASGPQAGRGARAGGVGQSTSSASRAARSAPSEGTGR